MKHFLFKIFYFLLPVAILSLPLDYCISHFLKQSNQYPGEFEVMNDIYDSNASCDVAIYGSSRAWVIMNPKTIGDTLNLTAYNFGIDGHNFWLQYLRHLEYQKFNKKPKCIVLSVDIYSLQKRTDLYYPNQFLPYMLWNKNIRDFTSSYKGFIQADYYVPLIRYFGQYDALNTTMSIMTQHNTHHKSRQFGFAGIEKEWNSDFEKAKANKESYKINFDANSIALLENFVNECKASNINLIFVYAPEYIEGQKYVSNRSQLMNIYRNIAHKHNVTFYDYSSDTLCLDQRYFYNTNHLNKRGAEIFSTKLAHDLKSAFIQHGYSKKPGSGNLSNRDIKYPIFKK